MTYNPAKHHRRSIRLKGYDYSQEGLYFITICTHNRACIFGTIKNGTMILNKFGEIAHNEWLQTIEIRDNVALGNFIIMPNHMHGIIRLFRRGELHSPNTINELHSPNTINELHSSNTINELHSSNTINKLHSPGINNLCNANNIGVFDTRQMGVCYTHETNVCDTHEKGVCDTHEKGVCDTPLRSPSQNIGAIVRGYKSSVTKQLGLLGVHEKIWQRNFYEHIIRHEQSFIHISEYIVNNPIHWADDMFHT